MDIRYRWALDRHGGLVAIEDAGEPFDRYVCPGCNNPLVAKRGNINAWHFAHAILATCNAETYLHVVAKVRLATMFRARSTAKKPFWLYGNRSVACGNQPCVAVNGRPVPLRHELARIDLSAKFDIASIERTVGGFRPDVVLSSAAHERQLWIEICVTHKSSATKLQAGNPLLEVRIRNDSDIVEMIRDDGLHGADDRVQFFNMKPWSRIVSTCTGACVCKPRMFVASLGPDGRLHCLTAAPREASRHLRRAVRSLWSFTAKEDTVEADAEWCVRELLALGFDVNEPYAQSIRHVVRNLLQIGNEDEIREAMKHVAASMQREASGRGPPAERRPGHPMMPYLGHMPPRPQNSVLSAPVNAPSLPIEHERQKLFEFASLVAPKPSGSDDS